MTAGDDIGPCAKGLPGCDREGIFMMHDPPLRELDNEAAPTYVRVCLMCLAEFGDARRS